MKNCAFILFLISLGFSQITMANEHKITLGGHFFADVYMQQHESGNPGTEGKRKAFNLERFRINLKANLNKQWQFVSRIQMKNGQDAFLRSAYIQSKNLFSEKDLVRVGVFSNFYKTYIYQHTSTRWLNKLGLHDIDESYNVNGESAALRYVYMPGNFRFGFDLINGEENAKTDTARTENNTNDKIGFGSYFSYKMGFHAFHLFYTATSKSTYQNSSNFTSTIPAKSTMAFDYTLNLGFLDLIAEYDIHDNGEGNKPKRIHFTADFNYADNKNFFLSLNKDDDDQTGDQSDSKVFSYVFGPSFRLENGIKTAVTYRFQSYEASTDIYEKTLAWHFEARF